MIRVSVSGSTKQTDDFLRRMRDKTYLQHLEVFGARGVEALRAATPEDSGDTAQAWTYEIIQRPGYYSIQWLNTHTRAHIPIAVLIQYGHGTRTGGYVHGIDYINPAMRPIFEQIAAEAWKEVTK